MSKTRVNWECTIRNYNAILIAHVATTLFQDDGPKKKNKKDRNIIQLTVKIQNNNNILESGNSS